MQGLGGDEGVPVIMNADLVLLAASIFLGLLFIGVSVPLIQKRIPPNQCYGLRIPATLADETVWYEANARAGKDILRLGLLITVVGAVLYLVRMPLWIEVMVWFVVVEGGVIGTLIRSWRFANQLLMVQQSVNEESA